MSTNTNEYLSPRGLLVNNKFCCDVPSFSQINDALQDVEKLPASDAAMQRFFTDTGFPTIYMYLSPIIEQFQEIQTTSAILRVAYRTVIEVCDRAIELGSSVRPDYDTIFDGLGELYNDPDNETLHRQIHDVLQERFYNMDNFSNIAAGTREDITSSTETLIEQQKHLEVLAKPLQDSSQIDELLHERDHTEEDVQEDMAGVQSILNTIAGQKMDDQSVPTLSDLEQLLGGVAAILSDITQLRDDFENDARPGPDLVLNLRKEDLIEEWDNLVREVQNFRDQYQM
ncbi:hypothetical protein F4818DRAFT_440142 [Hypoxylon cercidicola]|nr:hypothetical protein F4818DRAFT_440142 [Hypoxylon cercidicola]